MATVRVEDDGAVRRACCEIAGSMGFAVVSAEDVPEARQVLKRCPWNPRPRSCR